MDLVELVKRNPLKHLNGQSQNRFVQRVQQYFKADEQRLFVSSFYCYLNYDPEKDFVIDMDNVWEWLGFSQKGHCKRAIMKHFKNDADYKVALSTPARRKNEGGFNKETVLLTVDTFKELCMLSGTDKSKEIRKYFLQMEKVFFETLKEELSEQCMLLEVKDQQLVVKDQQLAEVIEESAKHKHNLILQEYSHDCNIVYIIKVKTLDGAYIIKIGESRRGIDARYNEHKSKYPECLILDCFPVKRCKDFETFLHSRLRAFRYKELQGHENETELFLVGKESSYLSILELVDKNIAAYNDDQLELNKAYMEIERLRLQVRALELEKEKGYTIQTNLDNRNTSALVNVLKNEIVTCFAQLKDEIVTCITQAMQPPRTTNNFGEPLQTIGPYVQQLNPETFALVRVYENISEVCKTTNVPRSSIAKAIKENTIYKNFRWVFVDRDNNPNVVVDVHPTKHLQKKQNVGYIAKLNNEKTEILNVYLDRKTASIQNKFGSVAYLDYFVKQRKAVNQNYYVLYDTISEDLQKAFLAKLGKERIVLYKNGIGQFDQSGVLINEFRSIHDCQTTLNVGNKSLSKALATGKAYNGYTYKHLQEKVCCI
ncbi:hypothetical protein EB118_06120 [bacterium]|nr:hypothetical protein [bacterium]NDC93788.1 hypothetical protein [bacterium]NDD83121.1 hypothetical protein [bacterium]NDG29654.1 hypothetical protein [bacterium]